ncbi:hypothetical protein GUA87_17635 [Sneathiella sp. P13V-1]|uniref:hypothetical protein n=1 Tax=Sneathiella sp. P13V-1 TaxID=2697366 RepID=UPI00187B2B70|nr:hypothetical protein [Sneathiella sp. P13V-1]MBE7638682.1 hypothetical protein [Sneathiella sp. P13V-1]
MNDWQQSIRFKRGEKMWRLLILFGVFVGLSSVSVVQADEIDDMVAVLNQKVMDQDAEGFGDSYAEFAKDARYKDYDYEKGGKQARSIITAMNPLGKPLSHSVVKKRSCGDRMEQVLTVFFAEQGQYVAEYWFFRAQEKWSLSAVNLKGEGSAAEFVKKLKGAMLQIC